MNDGMDTIRDYYQKEDPSYLLALFAEAVAITRRKSGVSIEDIGKCFRYQFDEEELSMLIHELNKGIL